MELLTDPIFVGAVMGIVGWAVERFAPQFIPFFAIGKKVAAELLELHNKSETPNTSIAEQAKKSSLKLAEKEISKLT